MRQTIIQHPATAVLTLLCAAALTACGGGDDPAPAAGTSADAATTYAADATMISSDATTLLDAGVQTAQVVVGAQATASATGPGASAASATPGRATPAAVTNALVTCPGGGTATLTITGGTDVSIGNGQLDAGEVYTLTYAACKGAAGAVALNGSLTLTVVAAGSNELSLQLAVTDLSASFARGSLTLAGNTAHSLTSATDNNGATVLTSHFTAPAITLSTQFNSRSSSFALSAVDITRQSTWIDGVLQSSSINGTHTLAATLPNAAFGYTVSTQGGVTYGADGTPATGAWTITLPNTLVGVSIANAIATITVDDGKDGTIDRTFTKPIGALADAAG